MSVAECIAKLVAAGTIDKKVAGEALDLYTRSKADYARTMGPAQAEGAAALAVAKAMESAGKTLKNDAAKQAIAYANAERTMLEHPQGRVA
ncbi:MAG: hypothetical protein IT520_11840, partial [Burkholderiales bacterium]|nr:hypothetical protein [Burkholderiales bacterium]